MTIGFFKWPATLAACISACLLAPGICTAQNSHLGTESELDRAMQQNAVRKDLVVQPNVKVKVSKAEESAYKALLAAQYGDPATLVPLAENFVARFPTSLYLPSIYGVLTGSYFALGDMDKMFSTGARAIQLDPENVDVMSLLAMAIPRRVKATTPDGAQQLQIAEAYAHRAIEIIPKMAKPAGMSDAAFDNARNNKLALAHSGLGMIAVSHQKYDDARAEFTQAVRLASDPDPVDYFQLGNADAKGSYFEEAAAAYEKCAISGPLMSTCKLRMESAKRDAEAKVGR